MSHIPIMSKIISQERQDDIQSRLQRAGVHCEDEDQSTEKCSKNNHALLENIKAFLARYLFQQQGKPN